MQKDVIGSHEDANGGSPWRKCPAAQGDTRLMLSKCGLDWQTQQREVVAGRFRGTRSLAAGWVQLLETGVLQKGCILPSTTFLSDLICWSHRHLCLRPEGVNRQLKAGGQASKREGSSSSENPGPREEMRGLPMGGTSTPGSGRMSRWARAGERDTADGEAACAKVKSGSSLLHDLGRGEKAGTASVTRVANVSRAPAT